MDLYSETLDHLSNRVENVLWCEALSPVTADDRAFLRVVKQDVEKLAVYLDMILKSTKDQGQDR